MVHGLRKTGRVSGELETRTETQSVVTLFSMTDQVTVINASGKSIFNFIKF